MKSVRYSFMAILLFWLTAQASASAFWTGEGDSLKNALLTVPESDYEYVPMEDYELIGDRFNCLNSEIPLEYNQRVYAFIQYFGIKDREYTRMILQRKDIYFPIFEKILRENDMPEDLKYLSIVESGLNPKAISRVGAVGLWQFMPYTGRSYGLNQDWYVDDRMDPYKSTVAAVKYLKSLYSMFDDWELAMAAYNSGPGNVRKAIRRSGYKKTFWEVYRYLPRETRSYVPQFAAIYYILNYADEHNFMLDDRDYLMAHDTVEISQFVNLKVVADQLNICVEDIDLLNPAIRNKALSDDVRNYPLRLPLDVVETFRANRSAILDSARADRDKIEYLARNSSGSTWGRDKIVYRVRSGDVLGSIAQRFGVRLSDLRKWNNINGSLIRAGQKLDIWVNPGAYKSTEVAQGSPRTIQPLPVPTSRIHVVQPGDTLWDISRKYEGLSIEKIKTLNNLKDNNIKPGQKLIIG